MASKKYLSEYLNDYLGTELEVARNFSDNSNISYTTSLMQFIEYVAKATGKKPSNLIVSDANFKNTRDFMVVSKKQYSWSESTWNARLAGVRAFINYLALVEPKALEDSRRVSLIQCQRIPKKYVEYLTEEELLSVIDFKATNFIELRDQTILSYMFYTGCRVSEVTNMKVQDIEWINSKKANLSIFGKGRKMRRIPLIDFKTTVNVKKLISETNNINSRYLFSTRDGSRMSSDNVRRIVRKYCYERFPDRNITPHSLRHSAAMNMLEAGIDLYTISSILGHENVATTEVYITSRFEEKEKNMTQAGMENLSHPLFKTKHKTNDDMLNSLKNFILSNRKKRK